MKASESRAVLTTVQGCQAGTVPAQEKGEWQENVGSSENTRETASMEPINAENGPEQHLSGEERSSAEHIGEAKASAWTPDISMRVKGITQTRVSPDGLRAVYVVREAVMTDDKSEYVTQIHLAHCDGSDSYPLTFGEKSSSDPQWSPDGKYIAFLSKRGETQNREQARGRGQRQEQPVPAARGGRRGRAADGRESGHRQLSRGRRTARKSPLPCPTRRVRKKQSGAKARTIGRG